MRPAAYSQDGAEKAESSLDLMKAVINSSADGVVVLDRDLRYLFVNEEAAILNGVPSNEHLGRKASDVVPDVEPLVAPFFHKVFESGQSVRQPFFQAQTPAMPGEARWWEVSYHPVFEGSEVVAVIARFVDVTERVTAQAQLDHKVLELRTILDVLPIGVAITRDSETSGVDLNKAYRRMLNLPASSTLEGWATSTGHRFTLDGKEVARSDLPLRKAAATGVVTEATRLDISFPDGGGVNVLAQAAPLILDGVVKGAVAAYADITEMVKTQEQLQKANRVQYDFLAMVSHELRTPLTMILGNAQLLTRDGNVFSDDERRGLAADVYAEAVNLTRIVENLLLLTRIDRGEQLDPEPVVLRHVCSTVLKDLELDGSERCRTHFPNEFAAALANPTSVELVMRNLIVNALKYSSESEEVDLSFEVGEREVVFRVADRGPGIEAGDRERVFEPFFRAASTSHRSGMGIGLAVCKRLMESMGGRIWAEARDGGGSVFTAAFVKVELLD